MAAAGILIGLAGAWFATRALSGLLFGVRPLDVPTIAAVVAILGAATLAATILPARHAATIDPATTLRQE